MWDFWSLSPESLHQGTILMSDRGCPTTPMHMNGYGSQTYSLINVKGERHWVKFHFKTLQGHKHYTKKESAEVIGKSRETYQEELFGAIEKGQFPKWCMMIQVMPETDAEKASYNPFDLTKVWPHAEYPLIEVGVLELTPTTTSPSSNRLRTRRRTFCQASASRPTRCCRRASSRTPTRTVIASAPTTGRCR